MQESITNETFTTLSKEDIELLELLKEKKAKLHFLYKQFIITFTIVLFINIAVALAYLNYTDKSFVYTVIWVFTIILTLVILLFSSILGLLKLWIDKKRLYNKVIARFSNQFVVANFFQSSKRFHSEICLIKEGKIIIYEKETYLIDWENIFLDDKRNPNIFYVRGCAISLKLDVNTVTFSDARALTEYRKSDFGLKELMANVNAPDNSKLIYIIIGVIIVIILVYMAFKSGDTVIIAKNVSSNIRG